MVGLQTKNLLLFSLASFPAEAFTYLGLYIYIVVALSQCAREVLCDIVDLHYDVSTRSISPDVSDLNLSPGAAPMVLKLSWSCPNSAMPSNRGIPRAR